MKLLLAAFPPELGVLLAAPPKGWRSALTGIGAISAAATTGRLIAEDRPEAVVFLGSCGAYEATLPIGSLVAVQSVLAVSLEERRGEAYRPGLETVQWSASISLPFPGCGVVVPPAITSSLEGAANLAGLGAVEHLELSGVFEACRQADVPCGAALVVVNEVGPEAHRQWKANHAEGSQRLITALLASGFFEKE